MPPEYLEEEFDISVSSSGSDETSNALQELEQADVARVRQLEKVIIQLT